VAKAWALCAVSQDLGEGGRRVEDGQTGADRALGVVLVGHRRSEHGHDGVADELLDDPAERFDPLPHRLVVGDEVALHVLDVRLLRRCGEAHQVAEQHRHHPTLALDRGHLGHLEGGAAERAERELPGKLLPTRLAGGHPWSLGRSAPVGRANPPLLAR